MSRERKNRSSFYADFPEFSPKTVRFENNYLDLNGNCQNVTGSTKTIKEKLDEIKSIIGDDRQLKFDVLKMLVNDLEGQVNKVNGHQNDIVNKAIDKPDCDSDFVISKLIENDLYKTHPVNYNDDSDYTYCQLDLKDDEALEIVLAMSRADAKEKMEKAEIDKELKPFDSIEVIDEEQLDNKIEWSSSKSFRATSIDNPIYFVSDGDEPKPEKPLRRSMSQRQAKKQSKKFEKLETDAIKLDIAFRIQAFFHQKMNAEALNKIEMLCKSYESGKLDDEADYVDMEGRDEYEQIDYDLNQAAVTALKMYKILNSEHINTGKFFEFFEPLFAEIKIKCDKPVVNITEEQKQAVPVNTSGYFHQEFLKYFCPVQVLGDGNCLWHSVSYNLFGDCSMTASLRLLTAATLVQEKDRFELRILEQKIKFGYKHALTFDGLVQAAMTSGVWGDEFHLLALSTALNKPIYSYGSFGLILGQVPGDASFKKLKSYCQSNDIQNHFRYVGHEEDEDKEPICIFYDGAFHYSPVVAVVRSDDGKKIKKKKPIKPKTLLLDYISKKRNTI